MLLLIAVGVCAFFAESIPAGITDKLMFGFWSAAFGFFTWLWAQLTDIRKTLHKVDNRLVRVETKMQLKEKDDDGSSTT